MDNDNPNLNNAAHDRKEWFESKKAEHQARVEKMEASEKMEANNGWQNFSDEFDAATDWTDASWDEFTAKVGKWWNAGEVKVDESI